MMQFISPQLVDEKLKPEKKYWLEKLSGARTSTGVPLDFARPAEYSSKRDRITLKLDDELRARLLQVSGNNDLLAFALLVAAVKICLHKYSGAEDIIVGATVHNRHGEVAALNRVFALRDRVYPQQLVKNLFAAVKQSLSEAYANQKYPFHRLVELSEIESPANRQAAFQVGVSLAGINDPEHLAELKTDINVVFSVSAGSITADMHYGPGLFKRQTIEQFGRHLAHVLRATLQDPGAAIEDIDLLSPERRHDLVERANRTARPFPLDLPIHQLFERQVAATPAATALECGAEKLTFGQLNERANEVAGHLLQLGVAPGTLVGLCFEHSVAMVVSLLGVLKAGGGYVPLDPAHPASRTAFVVQDAGIGIVLTQAALRDRLSSLAARTICVDDEWTTSASPASVNPPPTAQSGDIAYVIYTSGSTGQPKGVAVEHRSVVNYTLWAIDSYVRGEPLAFPLYSSFAFDLTVTSIFAPLLSGNTILIYPDRGVDHPLVDALRENRSGFLKLTPSHLSMILERGLRADRVRRVVVGGEAFPTELAWKARVCFSDDVEIFNEYGPTEATVGCMIHQFAAASDNRAFVPVGKPAANTSIYILDGKDRPVAENVTGELVIAGVGLARGYLNRPELTAQRFTGNPFSPGERMYRSGDLARWLPDGIIEYAGRKDDQVKFHGYRVELNEIRIALNGHPQVKDSVVVIGKDASDGDWMAAYYAAGEPVDPAELRSFLKDRVIEETIPNLFIHLAELPLTAHGKVNLRALPSLDEARANARRVSIAPRTQTEELLSGIWSQVLGLSAIGVTDDFFELGGHSLLAHQIISRARAVFQIEVPLRALFEAATIEQLAAVVDRLARERSGSCASAIACTSRDRDLPVSFGQQRLWVMDQMRAGSVSYNIYPSFELEGDLNLAALEQSVNEIVRRHESLRTTFRMKEGLLAQVIAPNATVAIPLTDLSVFHGAERDEQLESLIDRQVRQPFNLARGPLIRAHLARLEPRRHLLFIAMHHIASDAASMGIFYRELAEFYRGFCTRNIPKLAPLSVQYADYAVWQREWLQGEVLDRQVEYWREQLRDAPPVLDLLPGRSRPAVLGHEGTYTGLMLSEELSNAVKDLARRERCTLFMVLLAAFQTVLRYYARLDDILVGADIANRMRPELEGLIGFFVNTLVLRTSFGGNPRFTELLHRVRESALAAFSHHDVPFEKLVEELNPDRTPGQNPIFQIMFGFVPDNATMGLDLPGLALRPHPLDNKTSLFDLSLYMADTPRGLGGTAQYNTALYDGATISQFLRLFELVLSRVVARPDSTIAEIDAALRDATKQEQIRQAGELKEHRLGKLNQLRQPRAAEPQTSHA